MSGPQQAHGRALTVAVLAGGRSSEHEVSLSSGAAVGDGLLSGGHRVLAVEIGRDGVWRRDGAELTLAPGRGLLGADVAFPVLHGPFGEDGTVQGLLEMLDVPYVGAGVAASAVCLDKVLFKQLMSTVGLPQVGYVGVRAERFARARDQVLAELAPLGLPVFVKPAHLGSSVGIVKVADAAELESALLGAFAHDPLVIVEATARGLEVECGVLGLLEEQLDAEDTRGAGSWAPPADGAAAPPDAGASPAAVDARAFASIPGEVAFDGEFYDFSAKYTPGGMDLRIPAAISSAAAEQVRSLALQAFAASGCAGLARVDFFVDGERVLLNELNTMPGFTPTSVYAKLLDASGVRYPLLLERLCRLALERHERERAYSF